MTKRTKILLLIFIIVAIAQLWVPFSMILKHSDILNKGIVVKMKLTPRDPVHPFKGKYLVLNFEENNFTEIEKEWKRNETIYINYHINDKGFLKVDSLTKFFKPPANILKAKVNYYTPYNNKIVIKYPFDKYFIEESKAFSAEQKIIFELKNELTDVYAEISILNGNPVLKEVFVNQRPILEFIDLKD